LAKAVTQAVVVVQAFFDPQRTNIIELAASLALFGVFIKRHEANIG
jgi:hypothetical protein